MAMYGPLLILLFTLFLCKASPPAHDTNVTNSEHVRQVKLFDGVYMKVPEHGTGISFEITPEVEDGDTGRGKKKKMLEKFMPMFVMPFIIQSTIIPLFLGMIKFLLFKSLMIGKLALVLIILNAFRNHNSFKGRNDETIANVHYGYTGSEMEHYGSYFN